MNMRSIERRTDAPAADYSNDAGSAGGDLWFMYGMPLNRAAGRPVGFDDQALTGGFERECFFDLETQTFTVFNAAGNRHQRGRAGVQTGENI